MRTQLFMKFKPFVGSRFTRFMVLSIGLVMLASSARAQFSFPLRKTWDGPYDIRMIAAPNLEPVFVNTAKAASSVLMVDSLIPYKTIQMSGDLIVENNDYKEGTPFKEYDIPVAALECPDVNQACYKGLVENGTSACGIKYDNPALRKMMVAMNYSDYDNDQTTFSSSMAYLDISQCTEIEAAYLYWTGNFKGSNPNVSLFTPTPKISNGRGGFTGSYNGSNILGNNVFNTTTTSGYQKVKFKIPGGAYQDVTALSTIITTSNVGYICVADVTGILNGFTGGGEFYVGNIQSYPMEGNGGSTSGWVLVVVYKSPLSPPRRISLFDGYEDVSEGDPLPIVLNGLQAPATSDFKSYIGYAALDGENTAGKLQNKAPEDLDFVTDGTNPQTFHINPFRTDQPKYKSWSKKGLPLKSDYSSNIDACKKSVFDANWHEVYDGMTSSHITSYSEANDKNGNEIRRYPDIVNTLGFDAHHLKLPDGAVAPNATKATMTINAGNSGSTMPFMAYIAIERLQPKLEMTKASNVTTTGTDTEIIYTLKVKNTGNSISMGSTKGGDLIKDTLDQATTYIQGSLGTIPAGAVTFTSNSTLGDGRQSLIFNVSRQIPAKDSITITFKVKVKDFINNQHLWVDQCKRTITNTAWITYNTPTTVVLTSKSNGNDCGIGSETRVLIQDPLFAGSTDSTKLGPFNACPYITASVLAKVREQLAAAGVAAADVDKYDIRNSQYQRINSDSTFGAASNYVYYAIRDLAGGSGACQKVYKLTYTTCTLPLDLVFFNGELVQEGVVLQWTVSTNRAEHFVVERSTDGIHFSEIAVLAANGQKNYSYWDHPGAEGNVYYRLMHKEVSGKKSYSQIVVLNHDPKLTANFYPNPFAGTVQLIVKSEGESVFDINILDVSGKLVAASTGHATGESITLGKDLLAGVYIVEVILEGQKTAHRLVKLQ